MLNNIKLHINSNEKDQQLAEQSVVETINKRFEKNKEALIRYVPTIGKKIDNFQLTQFSVFIDKDKQINIVDFNSGRTLYTQGSDNNIQDQFKSWASNSAWLNLASIVSEASKVDNNNDGFSSFTLTHLDREKKAIGYSFEQLKQYANQLENLQKASPVDSLVCLGVGKATFLDFLVKFLKGGEKLEGADLDFGHVKHLVCYEPNWEWFICSLYAFDWVVLLELFQHNGLTLFLQIGTDVSQIYSDITELNQRLSATNILFYKHINLPVFNNIIRNIRNGRWEPNVFLSDKSELDSRHEFQFIQPFSSVKFSQWQNANIQCETYISNLKVLKEFYPEIHSAFTDYKPRCWQCIENLKSGEINLYNQYANAYFNNQNDADLLNEQVDYFLQNPNHDGLVLGYSADKLKHYLHNSFIRQSDFILRDNSTKQQELPESVKVLMVLGLGCGQLFDKICAIRDIQHLVVCEPNHDMFYASLFVVDWAKIIKHADNNGYHLYINIGESSSRLFKDVMSQFMQIGPHLLNETYILQSYENPLLSKMYYEVRQQLQVLFALGENFDHVAYGVAHTVQALTNNIPAMRFRPSQYLTQTHKQTPIFIVGNGPSLDENIEIIKEYREQVIVVSCGTALQALHRNGITPDFHGEVEQNRANFDWVSRIGDFDYLKQITLISVNGIHPDTIKLYKNALFAFKAGESSTHTAVSLYPKDSFHIIEHAYPTVTNMALSFFLALGFEQLYLVGIDLGFASKTKHHSASSGYYEQGKQIYNYEQEHSVDLKVKGNRQPWVYTKTEFNISRMLIEQLLQDPDHGLRKTSECFNLSNGVMIEGTIPLEPDSVLILSDSNNKTATLKQIQSGFIISNIDVHKSIAKAYSYELFNKQQLELKSLTTDRFNSKDDIQKLITTQSNLLKQAKQAGGSLFYYYFYNTVNASNALFTKARLIHSDKLSVEKANKILTCYNVFLDDAKNIIDNYLTLIDVAGAFVEKRESILIDINQSGCNIESETSLHPVASDDLQLPKLIPLTLVVNDDFVYCVVNKILSKNKRQSIKLTKFNNEVDGINWVTAQSEMSHERIITFYVDGETSLLTYTKLLNTFVTSHPKPSIEAKLNVVLVFTDFITLDRALNSLESVSSEISLQFIPPSISLMNDETMNSFNQGDQSGFDDKLWVETLILRSQNFYLFNIIINKPRFLKTGLEYASLKDAERNYLSERNIEECQIAENSSNRLDSESNVNEYVSKAVAYIQDNFVAQPIWEGSLTSYRFKHYFGVISEQKNNESRPITLLDKTNNRGLKLSRKPFAFELLGAWIDD